VCECIIILALTLAGGIVFATLEDRRAARHTQETQRIVRGER
jgi:hypothetical protein